AVADYVAKLPAASGKVAVTGFCWGGGQSFRFAANRPSLVASFVFYGPGPAKGAIARIKAPGFGFLAGNDPPLHAPLPEGEARINAGIPEGAAAMKEAGKKSEPITYEGAGHGFMRAGEAPDASAENKKARDEAWVRWKALLKKM